MNIPPIVRRAFLAVCFPAVVLALCVSCACCGGSAKRETVKLPFQGSAISGWRQPTGAWTQARTVVLDPQDPKRFAARPGDGVLFNGLQGPTSNLVSEAEYGDVEVHIEFNVPKESNSGVYLQGRYEIQIFDSWGVARPKSSDCGGIYASCSEPKPDFPGRPPAANAAREPGRWQTYDIVFRAPRFGPDGHKTENARFVRVHHNGKLIHENIEVPRPTCAALALDEKPVGPLLLQGDHGPVAYRNLRITPATLR